MNSILNLLMEQAYELEGLLLVAQSRGDSSQKHLYELISKKSAKIAELAQTLLTGEDIAAKLEREVFEAQAAIPPVIAAINESLEEEKFDPEATVPASIPDLTPEPIPEPISEPIAPEPVAPEPAETEESLTADNPNFPDALQWLSEDQPPEPPVTSVPDEDDEDEPQANVSEAMQRTLSRDLHRAFSLNDRFRFRRELFANNDVELNDTLNLVETMKSLDEAEDFFYNDLEWDKDSPEVVDFMNVIRNHFYNKNS